MASTITGSIEEYMIKEEEIIKEKEILQTIKKKKAIILKRSQGIPGTKVMQLLVNLNIFLFFCSLVPLLSIHMIVGYSVLGPLDTSLGAWRSSQI